jgi:hypothetical protein
MPRRRRVTGWRNGALPGQAYSHPAMGRDRVDWSSSRPQGLLVTTRQTAVVLLLALSTACATSPRVLLDTGQGEPVEYGPPAAVRPIKVGAGAFEAALSQMVLEAPLTLSPAHQGGLVRASYPSNEADTRWKQLMSKSYGGLCKPGQRRPDCLSLLDDAMGLSEWDKLGVALGLSIDPLKESIARAVEDTLAPQLFFTVIATGVVTWAVMAANPEPLFTKAAAIVSGLMLLYLGAEAFLELVDASRELKWATDRATTWEELKVASQRFARRVGPEVARVFVLAVTVVASHGMVGGSALLASRLSMLPQLPQAAAAGASRAGLTLANVAEVSAVAVVGNTLIISLPATAVAMVVENMRGGTAPSGASGQLHHPISKPIAKALEVHDTLKGHYIERDPRFVTRAADKASHNGYQKWHRDVDDEVIKWLDRNKSATPSEFEALLREIYSRPAMRARFPDGF